MIHMTGSDLENTNTNPADLAGLGNLALVFEGGSEDIDQFEVAGEDMGAVVEGCGVKLCPAYPYDRGHGYRESSTGR